MEQQETLTDGDAVSVDTEAATNRQSAGGAGEDDPQLARARDRQRTPSRDSLPDTERYQEAVADWFAAVKDVFVRLWDGSFWDEQPPSPRELVERYRESSWTHSNYGAVRVLRWLGMVASIAWSVPLYGLAILGQRIGRALTTTLIVWVFWHLI